MNQLHELLENARRQLGFSATYNDDGSLRNSIRKPAAAVSRFSMRKMEIPAPVAGVNHKTFTPLGTEAGKAAPLPSAVLAASRVVAAGAHLVIVDAATEALPVGNTGDIALVQRNAGFTCIEAADFSLVPDGTDVSASQLPAYRSMADLDTMPAYGFRTTLTRAEQKAYKEGELADSALVSIALGVARVADAVLLAAINAATPTAFTLAAAAAQGVEFNELRAMVGTNGTGATVSQDGILRVGGIMAELTPDNATTIVGAFNRAAVAVHEDIGLVAERTDAQGSLVLTCWVNAQALLPLPGAFWSVSA